MLPDFNTAGRYKYIVNNLYFSAFNYTLRSTARLLKSLTVEQIIEALVYPDYIATESKLIALPIFVTVLAECEGTYLRP
jgi:hypothetical protein